MVFENRNEKLDSVDALQRHKRHADAIFLALGGNVFNSAVEASRWTYDEYTVMFEFAKKNSRNTYNAVKITPFHAAYEWPYSVYSIDFGKRKGDTVQWEEGVRAVNITMLALCFFQYTRIRKPGSLNITKGLRDI